MEAKKYSVYKIGLFFDYDIYFAEQLKNNGIYANYTLSPLLENNKLKQLLFRFFSSKRFSIFSNRITNYFCCRQYLKGIPKFQSGVNYCFILNEISYRFLNVKLVSYLRLKYPNCKIVYSFDDKVDLFKQITSMNNLDFFLQLFDLTITYNLRDSDAYSLFYSPALLIEYDFEKNNNYEYDVFFVGKNKNRLDKLIEIYDILERYGYKSFFLITEVNEKEAPKRAGVVYNSPISYAQNIECVKKAKCILNLVQDGVEGISLRDYEAIGFNKLLLTNNISIKSVSVYNEKKVLFVDKIQDELYKINDFFESESWNYENDFGQKKAFDLILKQLDY